MKLEAYDLADKGDSVTYFRREMSILHKVLPKPGMEVTDILNQFTREQIEGIYPALSPIMIRVLSEELELMGYLDILDGKATVTPKGEAKLKDFIKSLTPEEKEALKM
jgi:ribosomal protein S19E (S16A)